MNAEEGLPVPSFRLLLLLPLVLAAVLLPGSAHSAAKGTALSATVGPGFTIKLVDANGRSVTQLDPGDYSITIRNLSLAQEHNFHLTGPGIDKASAFDNTTVTWDVTLVDGLYKYQCDAHPTIMKGSIRVGAAPPPPRRPPRGDRLHLRHDRPSEGLHAQSRQHRRQRPQLHAE